MSGNKRATKALLFVLNSRFLVVKVTNKIYIPKKIITNLHTYIL